MEDAALTTSPDRTRGSRESLTVVIVTYKVPDLITKCLAALESEGVGVIVVDNVSDDGTVEAVRAAAPSASLLENRDNVGFARANNQALRLVTTPYVCLLNPDTEVRPGALSALQQALEANPKLGIVGPRLVNPDGSLQSEGLRFPTACSLLGAAVPWARPPRASGQCAQAGPLACDWIIGACMVIRREVLEQVGVLDEAYFMYGEEKDLCYRAKHAGWEVACLPSAEVVHYGGQSAAQVPEQSYLAFLDSQVRFLRKFCPPRYCRLFVRATWWGCRLRQVGGGLLGAVDGRRRSSWRQKAEVARAGARHCAAYLRGKH